MDTFLLRKNRKSIYKRYKIKEVNMTKDVEISCQQQLEEFKQAVKEYFEALNNYLPSASHVLGQTKDAQALRMARKRVDALLEQGINEKGTDGKTSKAKPTYLGIPGYVFGFNLIAFMDTFLLRKIGKGIYKINLHKEIAIAIEHGEICFSNRYC
ncbi:MAG: hypothetical protein V3575_04930 [Candidatus Absconditabacteria bacterium]